MLDLVLLTLFAAFLYMYFALAVAVTRGPEDVYRTHLTQLFNARSSCSWRGRRLSGTRTRLGFRSLGSIDEVESTTLSRRALLMLERSAYDVVIAGVKMPELNGDELYDRVCALRPEMASRLIFITGDIDG